MADEFKYHIDHHVGLVPPSELLVARAAHAAGQLDDAGLRAAEDDAISDALRLQSRIGLAALGDGQFRRRHPLSVIYDNIDGFTAEPASTEPASAGPASGAVAELLGDRFVPERRTLRERPVRRQRLAKHEAEYLTASTRRSRVVSLPSPGYVLAIAEQESDELAAIIRDEVAALAAEGIEYVQLHDPVIGFLLTVAGREWASALGIDPGALLDRVLNADAAVTSDLPDEFRLGLDITTGGALDTRQGYHPGAVTTFAERQPFSRVSVEYPAQEQGRFPIEQLGADTVVALGIVDVSGSAAEPHEELLDRVDKAATVVNIDNIALSTNGAFSAEGPLNAREQRSRLQQVEIIARFYWGNEM